MPLPPRLLAFLGILPDSPSRVPFGFGARAAGSRTPSLPAGVVKPPSSAPAAAMLRRLAPWQRGAVRVGNVIPTGFDAYARVLHPASSANDARRVAWRDVAAWSGKTAHPEVQWEAIERGGPPGSRPWDDDPWVGRPDPVMMRELIDRLSAHTTTPDQFWLLAWEGYADAARLLADFPRVDRPTRSYFVLSVDRTALDTLLLPGDLSDIVVPSLLWPDDGAWCSSTEVDFRWTYAGGSRTMIDTLLTSPHLEALETLPEHRADIQGDRLNAG